MLKVKFRFFRSYDQQVIKIDRENGLKGLQSEKPRGDPGVTHMHTFLSGGEVFQGSPPAPCCCTHKENWYLKCC